MSRSPENSDLPSPASDPKIEAMALRYQKYLQKMVQSPKAPSALLRIKKSTLFLYSSMATCWNCLMPRPIRGPTTPYQQLKDHLTYDQKKQLLNIPLSRLSLSESIQRGDLTLVLALSSEPCSFLNRLNNHQQINLLIRNKAQILPVLIQKKTQKGQISAKIKELLSLRESDFDKNETDYILVCWKGLFEEVLVLAYFSLDDEGLCDKVLGTLNRRQEYETKVRRKVSMDRSVEELSQLELGSKEINSTTSSMTSD